jgi:hypothetical protein
LTRICANKFGDEWIHLEVGMSKGNDPTVDMVIAEPNEVRNLFVRCIPQKEGGLRIYPALEKFDFKLDFIAEIALILNTDENNKTYGYGKLLRNIESLMNVRQKAKFAALCFIDKVSEDYMGEFYENLQSKAMEGNIRLLSIFDSKYIEMKKE